MGKGSQGAASSRRSFRIEMVTRWRCQIPVRTERFETVPGRQAQIDWGECGTVEVGGEHRKLYVFVMVLGFSRMLFVRFTTSSKLPVLLSCLTIGYCHGSFYSVAHCGCPGGGRRTFEETYTGGDIALVVPA